MLIADCNMTLGEKLRYLREVEGAMRGLDREISQAEMARKPATGINARTTMRVRTETEMSIRASQLNGSDRSMERMQRVRRSRQGSAQRYLRNESRK